MKILSIETSCDETAVSVVAFTQDPTSENLESFDMKILGNALHSQIENHKEFGGVVPMMAKREHAKNLVPLCADALRQAGLLKKTTPRELPLNLRQEIETIFGREKEFSNDFINFISDLEKPDVDSIAVTEGPGLEPALWMGIIFARALSLVFNIPLIPVNHMEGHILSVLPARVTFPALALLISGGHTELVLIKKWKDYQIIGHTVDDAVGEAFDKVARMLGLPYPGGPEISKLAELSRAKPAQKENTKYKLPRPMIASKDYNFSFSGLKTSVLYSLKKYNLEQQPFMREIISEEFENAVTEVLITKTFKAVEEYNIQTLIIGGGVASNLHIGQEIKEYAKHYPELSLLVPNQELRTDNALMIAVTGYLTNRIKDETRTPKAQGNLSL